MTTAAQKAWLVAVAGYGLTSAQASLAAVQALPVVEAPVAWADRSASRMIAHRLAFADVSDANLAGRHPIADYGIWTPDRDDIDQYEEPTIDATGLRFDIITGKGIPDWYRKFPVPFGANSHFRMQFAWRCNRAFRDAVFQMRNTAGQISGWPGIKLAMISEALASSSWPKLVLSTMDQHFFPYFYGYDQNGNTRAIQPGINNGANFDWQPKLGEAPTCLYSAANATPQGQAVPGCSTLDADEWVELYVEADTGDLIAGTNTWDCERRLYMAFNGGPRELVIRFGPGSPGYWGRNAAPWTGLWLSCYMTFLDVQRTYTVTPSVWYRDLIIDDKYIPPMTVPEPAPQPAQTIVSFAATPATVVAGSSTLLAWQTKDARAVRLDGVNVLPNDSKPVTPDATRDYELKVDGNVPTVSRIVHVVVTQPSPDTGALPPWVPAPGTYAEFTTNKPADVGMNGGTLADWCGGAFIKAYGARGAVAYHGGREHSAQTFCQAQQAVYLLDCNDPPQFVRRCYPTETHLQSFLTGTPPAYSGTPNDEWGAFPDGSDGPMHTYGGQFEYPPEWNNGRPTLARVQQSAGSSKPLMGESWAGTWLYDLTMPEHTLANPAIRRINGSAQYHINPNVRSEIGIVSDAPTCWVDMIREGSWSFQRTSSGTRGLSFTSKVGVITDFALPGLPLARWSKGYHFADDDLHVVMCDEPTFGTTRFGVVKLLSMAANPRQWVTVLPTIPADAPSFDVCGYGGPQWSTILGCFVMFDFRSEGTSLRIWKLTPPPPGQRLTGTWAWTSEDIASADGSTVTRTNAGSVNGAWGRLVECPALRSLVWTRDVDKRGILIRPLGMA